MKATINDKICDSDNAILLEKDPDGISEMYDSGKGYLFFLYHLSWESRLFLLDLTKHKPYCGEFPRGGKAILLGENREDKNAIWITISMFNKIIEWNKQLKKQL